MFTPRPFSKVIREGRSWWAMYSQAAQFELGCVDRLLRAERAAHAETRQALQLSNVQLYEARRSVAALAVAPPPGAATPNAPAAAPMQLNITMSQPKERHNSARRIAERAEVMVAMSVFRGELALLEGQLRRTVEREADIVQLGVRALLAGEVPALRDSLKMASYEFAAARAGEGGDVGAATAEAAAKASAAITSEMARAHVAAVASDDQVLAARREAEEARREAELLQAQLRELREAAAARIEADAPVGQAACSASASTGQAAEQAAAARREADAARRVASEAAAQAEALHRLVQEHRSEAQAERREVERLRKREMDLTATIRRQADQLSQASMQLQSTAQELSATKSERAAAQQLEQQQRRKEKKEKAAVANFTATAELTNLTATAELTKTKQELAEALAASRAAAERAEAAHAAEKQAQAAASRAVEREEQAR